MSESIRQAAANIAAQIGVPASRTAHLLYSPGKAAVARAVGAELRSRSLAVSELIVDDRDDALRQTLREMAPDAGYIILVHPRFALALFETVGRPDQGVKAGSAHLFCDWFMPVAGLVRTYAIDIAEQEAFRSRLMAALGGAGSIRITTALGADLTLRPRHWNSSWGELFTAPVRESVTGTAIVDGSVYYAPARTPFPLTIRDGRLMNLGQLDHSDPQQKMLWTDLTCDDGASLVAELGIGVNTGADPTADLMEAEQCRGTCHIGFGHNLPMGGTNRSHFHGDLVLMKPTIAVDGQVICREGRYEW